MTPSSITIYGESDGNKSSFSNTTQSINSTFNASSHRNGFRIRNLSQAEECMWHTLYATICFLAVTGNAVVIFIICSRKHMRTATNIFIANLAVADALSGSTGIPLRYTAAFLQRWVFPDILCHLVLMVESATLSVSVLTLCAIAVDRFRTITFHNSHSISTTRIASIVSGIWLFAFATSHPYGYFHSVGMLNAAKGIFLPNTSFTEEDLAEPGARKVCFPLYANENWWKIYNIYLTIVTYFVPLVVIDTTYAYVAWQVYQWTPPMSSCNDEMTVFIRSKKKVARMIALVLATFTFCWLPYEVYLVMGELLPAVNSYRHIRSLFFCVHWVAMSNTCINPIIYGCFNEKFRREYKQLLLKCMCRPAEANNNSKPNSSVLLGDSSEKGTALATPPRKAPRLSMVEFDTSGRVCHVVLRNGCAPTHAYIAAELGYDVSNQDNSFQRRNARRFRGTKKLKVPQVQKDARRESTKSEV